ncbi:MAG: hypothetical protein AAF975_02945 [Spirochaetota bacterium]
MNNVLSGLADHPQHKRLWDEFIRKAVTNGQLHDEMLAYISALDHISQKQGPEQLQAQQLLTEAFATIQDICHEKTQADAAKDFGIPAEAIDYLERQKVLLQPLEIHRRSHFERGEYRHFCLDNQDNLWLRALNDHWIGLYFQTTCGANLQAFDYLNPILVENAACVFEDMNLRGSCIEIFYPALKSELAEKKNRHAILCLNLTFRNCRVRDMQLPFSRNHLDFPGTFTVNFENCEDFQEADFPYLKPELDGPSYYIDVEALPAHCDLSRSEYYKYEHYR